MTDLERIAQAAYESMIKRTFGDDSIMANEANPFLRGEWSAQTQELKDDWLAVASAAVETIRESSGAMQDAADKLSPYDLPYHPASPEEVFRVMCDTILNEKVDG